MNWAIIHMYRYYQDRKKFAMSPREIKKEMIRGTSGFSGAKILRDIKFKNKNGQWVD